MELQRRRVKDMTKFFVQFELLSPDALENRSNQQPAPSNLIAFFLCAETICKRARIATFQAKYSWEVLRTIEARVS